MKKFYRTTALAVLCTVGCMANSQADQAIIIGGGYNINGSQGQIELNVKWVQEILKSANMPVTTFFTDGDNPEPDVHYRTKSTSAEGSESAIEQLSLAMEPVARLFNNQYLNQKRFRNHTVSDVRGSTRVTELKDSLSDLLSSAPNDPSLIVYNGHGKQSNSTVDKVTLELWDDTQLTAAELHGVLNESQAATRFIFTQCYSGGFHRLAYKNPESGLALSDNLRCGFTSESAYRLAEGCSASIDTDDYRDYTTFFFAALTGYDRNGEILPIETDANTDGEVTMREAHFYTLGNAHSTDLSRSTSEDYLTSWEPWYLKWNSAKPGLPNNEYAKLFRNLAAKHNISLDSKPAKSIRASLNGYLEEQAELQAQRDGLFNSISEIQQQLIVEAAKQWPAIVGPYTAGFQAMTLNGELLSVSEWLLQQDQYKELVAAQDMNEALSAKLLDTERNVTQMQKLLHFRKLSNLKHDLYQHGSSQEISDYERLVGCEDAPVVFSEKIGMSSNAQSN